MRSLKIASFVVAAFSVFAFAHAQSIPGISNPLTITVLPEAPRADEPVAIGVQSFSFDIQRSLVTWSVDGKEVSSGVGQTEFALSAGPLGTTKIVTIAVTVPNMGTFSDIVVIRPADVALVWEADTYTPPFYRGKALHSYNGSFKVVAIPELYSTTRTRLDPAGLIYTWRKNGEIQPQASGYGKSTFTTSQTSYLREGESISVEVSAPNDSLVATANILVIPTVPRLVFYEDSPLYGVIYEKALTGRVALKNEEITVSAEPFFFSVPSALSGILSYDWKLNNEALTDLSGQRAITLRKTTGATGSAVLSLTSQSSAKVLQGGRSALTIVYE